MDVFSKDGFSGDHIPLISVLICIISIDKKYIACNLRNWINIIIIIIIIIASELLVKLKTGP